MQSRGGSANPKKKLWTSLMEAPLHLMSVEVIACNIEKPGVAAALQVMLCSYIRFFLHHPTTPFYFGVWQLLAFYFIAVAAVGV